ncbi:hypothetical protein ABEG18_09255 [Alsobacter sp. KACC 23698]|uniref:Secreted protein n=1 Tax=Alsobacter sp. KACC 23698 TaxID=3149229 RepID=A0AAU7JL82_9HYPH
MSKARAVGSATLLFVGMAGSLGGLGALVFEEIASLAVYGVGVTAGAAWLSIGTYRTERAAQAEKAPPPEA